MKVETYAENFRKTGIDAEAYKRGQGVAAKMWAVAAKMKQKDILTPPLQMLLEASLNLLTNSIIIPTNSIRSPSGYLRRISVDLHAARPFNQ